MNSDFHITVTGDDVIITEEFNQGCLLRWNNRLFCINGANSHWILFHKCTGNTMLDHIPLIGKTQKWKFNASQIDNVDVKPVLFGKMQPVGSPFLNPARCFVFDFCTWTGIFLLFGGGLGPVQRAREVFFPFFHTSHQRKQRLSPMLPILRLRINTST